MVLLVSSLLEMRRHMLLIADESRHLLLSSTLSPTISILAPAFNEEATIEGSLRALLALQYPNLEVIVISDGSKDNTIPVLIDRFDLVPVKTIYEQRIKTKSVRSLYRSSTYPALVVVDKENGGKADALNVGLSFAKGELVCAMDADTLIEADGLQRMVRPFLVCDGCRRDRRNDPGRQRLGSKVRASHQNPRPDKCPRRHPGGGVPPRLPVRPAGMEPAWREYHNLRRLRSLQARISVERGWLPARHRRRGHGARAETEAALVRARGAWKNRLCPGPGGVDRSPGIAESAWPPTRSLASRTCRRPVEAPAGWR